SDHALEQRGESHRGVADGGRHVAARLAADPPNPAGWRRDFSLVPLQSADFCADAARELALGNGIGEFLADDVCTGDVSGGAVEAADLAAADLMSGVGCAGDGFQREWNSGVAIGGI